MKDLIIKKFVKNPENVKDPQTRESYGSVAGAVGIVSNLILCTFKILTGVIFNSIAILSDGINNLADASSSLITLFGFKLASRKPDKDHPYGHGRTEYLTSLVISVMIIVIGASLLMSSVDKTLHPEELDFSIISIVVLIVAIAIKLWQTGFNMAIGKLINSEALLATGADSRNDVISTSAVLVSVIIGKLTGLNLDGPVGIVVALFILWSGISLVMESVAPIMGKAPEEEVVKELTDTILSADGILGYHDLMIHDYGPGRLFASVHAEVDGADDVFDIHDKIDNLEFEVRKNLGILLTIHMDPIKPNDPETVNVKAQLEAIASKMQGVGNIHDVRIVPGPTHTNVVFDAVMYHDCKLSQTEVNETFRSEMKKIDPKYILVITLDNSYI